MLALIGAGYTLQRFKNLYPDYAVYETHRDILEATESEIKGDLSFLKHSQGLVFSLTPSAGALNLADHLSFDKTAILLSSIGVYAKTPGKKDERSPLGETDRAGLIANIENKFLKMPHAVVLRLGGLFDEHRHPVNSIIRNNSTIQGSELINFVHINDVCEAIHILLNSKPKQRIYNLVDTNHPKKQDYYPSLTDSPINFSQDSDCIYEIDSSRFINEFETSDKFLNKVI